MKYPDGTDIEPGEIVQIGDRWRGTVIASIDTGKYLPGEEHWDYLEHGIMVDTDFAGLIHYSPNSQEDFLLLERLSRS